MVEKEKKTKGDAKGGECTGGISRRTFLKVAAGTAAVAAAGGVAWHMLRPPPLPEMVLKSAIPRADALVKMQSPDGGLGIRSLGCAFRGRTGQTCLSSNPARALMSLYDATGYVRYKRAIQGMVHWFLYVNEQNPDGSWHQFQDIDRWHAAGTSLAPEYLILAYNLLGDESGITKAELDDRITRAAAAQTNPEIARFTTDPAPHWPHSRPTQNSARPTSALIRTYLETGERRWLDIARASADWAIDEQAPEGYFDTPDRILPQGRLLDHTLLILYPITGDRKYLDSAVRLCDWLLEMQRPEGSWSGRFVIEREPIGFQDGGHLGMTGIISRGMCQTYWYTGDERYLSAAERAIGWMNRVAIVRENPHRKMSGMYGISLNKKVGCTGRPIEAMLAYLRVKGELPMYGPTNGLGPLSHPVGGR